MQMDAMNRSCVVSAHFGSHQVHLVVKFPDQYPNNAAPTFQFVSPTTISSTMKTKIQKVQQVVFLRELQSCRFTVFRFRSDPEGHVSPEGEEELELPGAVCPTAGVLPGV